MKRPKVYDPEACLFHGERAENVLLLGRADSESGNR